MADLRSRDRLQPSLLDRLTDDQPLETQETVEARVLTRQQLRAAVMRDLGWLFNAIRPEPESKTDTAARRKELSMWRANPHAARSVLNFGLPAFAGVTKSRLDTATMEAAIKQAIAVFEPRIDAKSLSVSLDIAHAKHHNALQLTIRGTMWAQPVPLEVLLGAEVDLETGNATLVDRRK